MTQQGWLILYGLECKEFYNVLLNVIIFSISVIFWRGIRNTLKQ